jgi:hypothetical protein
MKKIEILSGDIDQGKWEISDRKLRKGRYIVKEIPIKDIISITTEEQIGNKFYIKVELGTFQSFKAVAGNSAYNELYSDFSRHGNQSVSQSLPLSRYSLTEFFFIGVAGIFLVFFFIGQVMNGEPEYDEGENSDSDSSYSADDSEPSATSSLNNFDMTTLSSDTKIDVCKSYIGKLFGKPTSIIEYDRTDDSGHIYVKYVRENDNTLWNYVCNIKNKTITWAGWMKFEEEWGRWRDEDITELRLSPNGEAVLFTPPNHTKIVEVTITQQSS